MQIGIVGANGRVGKKLLECLLANRDKSITLSSAYIRSPKQLEDYYLQKLAQNKLTTNLQETFTKSQVVIDFSLPNATNVFVNMARKSKTPLVIGTTNLDNEQLALINEVSTEIPILQSSNMSYGINLLAKIMVDFGKQLYENFDIEIEDIHHKNKLDQPSGTAKLLGKKILQNTNQKLANVSQSNRVDKRQAGEIGFSSMRCGEIAGEHSVFCANDLEILQFNHRVIDRKIFAYGAIKAAKWLYDQPSGLYSMQDLLC